MDSLEQIAMEILATLCNPPFVPLEELQSKRLAKSSNRKIILSYTNVREQILVMATNNKQFFIKLT